MTIRPRLLLVPLLSLLLVSPPAASEGAKPAGAKPAAPGKPAAATPAAKAPAASKAGAPAPSKAPEARSLEHGRALAPLETKATAVSEAAVALRERVRPLADERRQVQAKIDALKPQLAAHLRKADLDAARYNKAQEAYRVNRGPLPSAALLASARAEYAAAETQIGEMKRLLTRLQAIEAQLNDAASGAAALDTEIGALQRELTPARTRWRTLTSELDTLARKAIAATGRSVESSGYARAPAAQQRRAELDQAAAQRNADLAEARGGLAAVEQSTPDSGAAGKPQAKAPGSPESKPAPVAAKEAKRETQ